MVSGGSMSGSMMMPRTSMAPTSASAAHPSRATTSYPTKNSSQALSSDLSPKKTRLARFRSRQDRMSLLVRHSVSSRLAAPRQMMGRRTGR
nr:TPA_asm: m22.5 sORF [Murid betaherpesvirus 1]DBA07739.1 TPA_asm: m22.5 sORF [Murid betaherpesvirus 1]